MSLMPGWICGVILSTEIMEMPFPLKHRQSSMGSSVLYGVYFLSFLDGDQWRLFRFREAILDREGSFRVICFQEQIPFLKQYLGNKVSLSTVKMETVEQVFRIEGKSLL
jgi:hypothetical protein